jgi:hypothetical protein
MVASMLDLDVRAAHARKVLSVIVKYGNARAPSRPFYGALKTSELRSKKEVTRFVNHLVCEDILRIVSERLEKKEDQKFANCRQSVTLGPAAKSLLDGCRPVHFGIQVRALQCQADGHE